MANPFNFSPYTNKICLLPFTFFPFDSISEFLPPSFPDDPTNPSTLNTFYTGKSSGALGEESVGDTDFPAGYSFKSRGYTVSLTDAFPIVGTTLTQGNGTAVLAYDGTTITVTTAGTLWGFDIDGEVFHCADGTLDSTDGAYCIGDGGTAIAISTTDINALHTEFIDGVSGTDLNVLGYSIGTGIYAGQVIPPHADNPDVDAINQLPLQYQPRAKYPVDLVQSPCLDVLLTDTIAWTPTITVDSTLGTAVISSDGTMVTTAGTLYKIVTTDGKTIPCSEENGAQVFSKETEADGVTPLVIGDITTTDLTAMRAGRQQSYFPHSKFGYGKRENLITSSEDYSQSPWAVYDSTLTQYLGYSNIENTSDVKTFLASTAISGLVGDELTVFVECRSVTDGDQFNLTIWDSVLGANIEVVDSIASFRWTTMRANSTAMVNDPKIFMRNFPTTTQSLDISSIRLVKTISPELYSNGDSIGTMAVMGSGNSHFNSYTSLFAINNLLEVVDTTTGGETLAQIAPRVTSDLLGKTFTYMFINGGTNDIFSAGAGPDPSDNMLTKMAEIVADGKVSITDKIVMLTCPVSPYWEVRPTELSWVQGYNAGLRDTYASDDKILLVDLDAILDTSDYSPDGIHVRYTGHDKILAFIESNIMLPDSISQYSDYIKTTDTTFTGEEYLPFLTDVEPSFLNNGIFKFKLPPAKGLIGPDLLANLAGDGPYLFNAGVPNEFTQAIFVSDGVVNENKLYYMCDNFFTYTAQLTSSQDIDVKDSQDCWTVTGFEDDAGNIMVDPNDVELVLVEEV